LAEEHEAQGNHAAAEAIYRAINRTDDDPIAEVYRWYEELERTSVGTDVIHAVEERIESEPDAAKQRELKFILALEYTQEQDYAASEAIYLELFQAKPDDPLPLIKLAEQKLYFERQLEGAMRLIDQAIAVAYGSGKFRRNALSVKARIALATNEFQVVEGMLKQIMQLGIEYGYTDTGSMRDFFDRLPPGSIDPEVARQYDEHCRTLAQMHRSFVE
jgi:tetratricopeptide (TPR) repeat protein